MALLLLIPITYGLGFLWFATGLAPPPSFKSGLADWVGSVAFGFTCGVLAFGISRLLIRGAVPLAAALGATAPIVALTAYLIVRTFAYREVIPLVATLMDSLGFILGLIAAALPGRLRGSRSTSVSACEVVASKDLSAGGIRAMKRRPICLAALVAALLLAIEPGIAAASRSPARTVGFVVGSVAIIKPTCGYDDDPDGIGRLLIGAKLAKLDILPGGRLRAEFEAGGIEARSAMGAKLQREGRERFCAFALTRFGPAGLSVIRL